MQGASSSAAGLCYQNGVPQAQDSHVHSALAVAVVCNFSAAKASAGNDNMHAAAWKVKIAAEGWQACAACESVNSGLSYPFFPTDRELTHRCDAALLLAAVGALAEAGGIGLQLPVPHSTPSAAARRRTGDEEYVYSRVSTEQRE